MKCNKGDGKSRILICRLYLLRKIYQSTSISLCTGCHENTEGRSGPVFKSGGSFKYFLEG